MNKKHVLVLGLKAFGMSIVKELVKYNCEVLAIDRDMEKVEEADDYATKAIQMDIHDAGEMHELSLNSFDVAIITVNDIETSIMAALLFKENGIPDIIVKAKNEIHKKILEKMEVDRIISPDEEMGVKLAKGVMNERLIDTLNLSDKYSIIEINVLEKWIGKSLRKLGLRENCGINVLCIKKENAELKITPNPDYRIEDEDILIALIENGKMDI